MGGEIPPTSDAMSLLIIIAIVLIAGTAAVILSSYFDASLKTVCGAVALIVLVAAVAVPVLTHEATGEDPTDVSANYATLDDLHYDDYVETYSINSASGSVELVTYSGHTYVHASGVGSGAVTYADGAVKSVTVSKADLDVYLILGQSNGAYRVAGADPSEVSLVPYLGTCYYYGNSQNPVVHGQYDPDTYTYGMHSMTRTILTAQIGDFEEAFAAYHYQLSGHKTYIINGCIGGTGVESWVPGGWCYTWAQGVVDDAIDAIDLGCYSPSIEAMIWVQGEHNASMSVATYEEDFLLMYDAVADGSFCGEDVATCLIVKVRSVYANPSDAQEALARSHADIYLASSVADSFTVANGCIESDDVHYSQIGDNILGESVAKFWNMIQ